MAKTWSTSGNNSGGPTSVTVAPSFVNPRTFDRATLLCAMSPTIAMCSPERSSVPKYLVNVTASRSAWVGKMAFSSSFLRRRTQWRPKSMAQRSTAGRCARKCDSKKNKWSQRSILSHFICLILLNNNLMKFC